MHVGHVWIVTKVCFTSHVLQLPSINCLPLPFSHSITPQRRCHELQVSTTWQQGVRKVSAHVGVCVVAVNGSEESLWV